MSTTEMALAPNPVVGFGEAGARILTTVAVKVENGADEHLARTLLLSSGFVLAEGNVYTRQEIEQIEADAEERGGENMFSDGQAYEREKLDSEIDDAVNEACAKLRMVIATYLNKLRPLTAVQIDGIYELEIPE